MAEKQITNHPDLRDGETLWKLDTGEHLLVIETADPHAPGSEWLLIRVHGVFVDPVTLEPNGPEIQPIGHALSFAQMQHPESRTLDAHRAEVRARMVAHGKHRLALESALRKIPPHPEGGAPLRRAPKV